MKATIFCGGFLLVSMTATAHSMGRVVTRSDDGKTHQYLELGDGLYVEIRADEHLAELLGTWVIPDEVLESSNDMPDGPIRRIPTGNCLWVAMADACGDCQGWSEIADVIAVQQMLTQHGLPQCAVMIDCDILMIWLEAVGGCDGDGVLARPMPHYDESLNGLNDNVRPLFIEADCNWEPDCQLVAPDQIDCIFDCCGVVGVPEPCQGENPGPPQEPDAPGLPAPI